MYKTVHSAEEKPVKFTSVLRTIENMYGLINEVTWITCDSEGNVFAKYHEYCLVQSEGKYEQPSNDQSYKPDELHVAAISQANVRHLVVADLLQSMIN